MPPVEFSLSEENGYFLCVTRGDVPDGALGYDPYAALPDGARLLVDNTGLGAIGHPQERWAAMAIGLEIRGLKVAVVARNEEQRRLYEEALSLARVDRERQFAVFTESAEAVRWLRSDAAGASQLPSARSDALP